MRTNTGITIYNKYISSGAEKYQRTQIPAVAWTSSKARTRMATGGDLAADQAMIYFPYGMGANHLDPKAWQALTSKTGKWTLQIGDIVVKGLVTDDIKDAVVSPPAAAFTASMLKAKYDDVLAISSVDFMDLGSRSLWHWQVGAK